MLPIFEKITEYWTRQKEKEILEKDEGDQEELEFKTFPETYKMISFALSVGIMYPNPQRRWTRLLAICVSIVSVAPLALFILIDIFRCMLRRDIIELIRHSTMVGPFLAGFVKMIFMIWKETPSYAVITEINRDYALYNRISPEYKDIVRESLYNSKRYSEKWWTVTVIGCVMTFPAMAVLLTVHSYFFHERPQKFMVHEVNKPWDPNPEARFESPYYELLNLYEMYAAVFYVVNFLGYDGFYGLAINHACLKIRLYCKALEDAMKYKGDEVYTRMAWVVQEQNRTYDYASSIHDAFNYWLGLIFLATMIQLCNLLYHISEGYGFDVRYMIFIAGVIVHIYLPCRYSAKLKATSINAAAEFYCCGWEHVPDDRVRKMLIFMIARAQIPIEIVASIDAATEFYCCGWEHVPDDRVRKMLIFMIARAQIPIEIVAVNMITFDMELFVSILQTSYSMYTLLSS